MPDGSSTSVDSGGVPTPWRNRGKRGWGIDEPRTVIELFAAGILSVVVGVIISAYTSASSPRTADLGLLIGPAVGFLIFVLASALYWSSRSGKVREVAKMVGNIPYTPRVKKVLALAQKEAKQLNHNYVGTEHILLGLLR